MLHLTDPIIQFIVVCGALLLPTLLSGLFLRALTTDFEGWDSFGRKIVNVVYYTLFISTTILLVGVINELEVIYRGSFEPISVLEKVIIVSLLQWEAFLITLRK